MKSAMTMTRGLEPQKLRVRESRRMITRGMQHATVLEEQK